MRIPAAKNTPKGLPDLMAYAALLEPGIVLTKDGRLLAGLQFAGPDNDSLTVDELNRVSAQMNAKLMRLGEGWGLHVDAVRRATVGYPARERQHFPDDVTQWIDDERRVRFEGVGEHYETAYYIVLSYMPPSVARSRLEQMMYSDSSTGEAATQADKVLDEFVGVVHGFAMDLRDIGPVRSLAGEEGDCNGVSVRRDGLVSLLHQYICGRPEELNIPSSVIFLDSLLGRFDLIAGLEPILDGAHLRVVAIDAYPPETWPGILRGLDRLPLEYRWSNRFLYLDKEAAKAEIQRFRRRWGQQQRGLLDQIFQTDRGGVNRDAVEMVDETEEALAAVSGELVAFGYYTSVVVLQDEDVVRLDSAVKQVMAALRRCGCSARLETLNSMDAWIGSLPGHNWANVRRPLIHTLNLADLLPLTSLWPGREHNPCDMYPPESPPLVYADTDGASIFRLNLHVRDVGHTLILGPTGSGKSTLLALLAAQFRKYSQSQIFCFDKGFSMYCLTRAAGGVHFDIAGEGEGEMLVLSPLQDLTNQDDLAWAEGWLRDCCELQMGSPLSPDQRGALRQAVKSLSEAPPAHRSLSDAVDQLQATELRSALSAYIRGEGTMGHLLDGTQDGLSLTSFATFELESLMNYDDRDKLPVLLYLFRRVEKALTGLPALIILDEAWLMLAHAVFRNKIVEWLKVMRKSNAAVVMATQSLSDATNSGILDVLLESTATRIFLPNAAANTDISSQMYRQVGMNAAEIDLVAAAKPKQQYYAVSADGARLFDLGLGPATLAFCGQSGPAARAAVDECISTNGDGWPVVWLRQHGVDPTTLTVQ